MVEIPINGIQVYSSQSRTVGSTGWEELAGYFTPPCKEEYTCKCSSCVRKKATSRARVQNELLGSSRFWIARLCCIGLAESWTGDTQMIVLGLGQHQVLPRTTTTRQVLNLFQQQSSSLRSTQAHTLNKRISIRGISPQCKANCCPLRSFLLPAAGCLRLSP